MRTERILSSKNARCLILPAVAMAGAALSGCSGKHAEQKAPPPPLVGVVESRRMDVPVVDNPNGPVVALEEVTLRARVRGFIDLLAARVVT